MRPPDHPRPPVLLLLLAAAMLLATPARGAAYAITRSFDRTVAMTSEPIIVTVNFTNDEAVTWRGFYYSDPVPSGLEVTTNSVAVNGQAITSYVFESGQDGDVSPGCTPRRWILEQPLNFIENHPLSPQASVQITYQLHSMTVGTFVLPPSDWVGFDPGTSAAGFGSLQSTRAQSVSFLATFLPAQLSLMIANDHVVLSFPTVSNITYLVEYADDLGAPSWQRLTSVTGAGATVIVADDAPLVARRFYRVRLP